MAPAWILAGAPAGALTLESLGHSAFLLTSDQGFRIVIDPYADNEWPGLDLPPVNADAVLVTHPHWDHDAWRSVRGKPEIFAEPGSWRLKDVGVLGLAGRHAPIGGEGIDWKNTVFVLEANGLRLCHLGDNGPPDASPGLARSIGKVDVLMIPVDSEKRVLDDDGAAAWMEALAPRVVIPMHYRIPEISLERVTGIGTIDGWLGALAPGWSWEMRGPGPVPILQDGLPATHQVWVLLRNGQPAPRAAPGGEADRHAARQARERAQVALAGGDTPVALENLQQAAQADPDDVDVHQMIGFLYLNERRPDRALESFVRGVDAAGGKPEGAAARAASLCWLGRGMSLDLLGRRDEAVEAYRNVIALGINDDLQLDNARRWIEGPYTEE